MKKLNLKSIIHFNLKLIKIIIKNRIIKKFIKNFMKMQRKDQQNNRFIYDNIYLFKKKYEEN